MGRELIHNRGIYAVGANAFGDHRGVNASSFVPQPDEYSPLLTTSFFGGGQDLNRVSELGLAVPINQLQPNYHAGSIPPYIHNRSWGGERDNYTATRNTTTPSPSNYYYQIEEEVHSGIDGSYEGNPFYREIPPAAAQPQPNHFYRGSPAFHSTASSATTYSSSPYYGDTGESRGFSSSPIVPLGGQSILAAAVKPREQPGGLTALALFDQLESFGLLQDDDD